MADKTYVYVNVHLLTVCIFSVVLLSFGFAAFLEMAPDFILFFVILAISALFGIFVLEGVRSYIFGSDYIIVKDLIRRRTKTVLYAEIEEAVCGMSETRTGLPSRVPFAVYRMELRTKTDTVVLRFGSEEHLGAFALELENHIGNKVFAANDIRYTGAMKSLPIR